MTVDFIFQIRKMLKITFTLKGQTIHKKDRMNKIKKAKRNRQTVK